MIQGDSAAKRISRRECWGRTRVESDARVVKDAGRGSGQTSTTAVRRRTLSRARVLESASRVSLNQARLLRCCSFTVPYLLDGLTRVSIHYYTYHGRNRCRCAHAGRCEPASRHRAGNTRRRRLHCTLDSPRLDSGRRFLLPLLSATARGAARQQRRVRARGRRSRSWSRPRSVPPPSHVSNACNTEGVQGPWCTGYFTCQWTGRSRC